MKILGIIEQLSKICVWCLNSWKKPFNHATSTRWALTFQNPLREKTNYSLCTNLWVSSSVFLRFFLRVNESICLLSSPFLKPKITHIFHLIKLFLQYFWSHRKFLIITIITFLYMNIHQTFWTAVHTSCLVFFKKPKNGIKWPKMTSNGLKNSTKNHKIP